MKLGTVYANYDAPIDLDPPSMSARPVEYFRGYDFLQGEGDIPLAGIGGIAIQATYERNGQFYLSPGGYLGAPGANISGGDFGNVIWDTSAA